MMKLKQTVFLASLVGLLGASWPFSWLTGSSNKEPSGSGAWIQREIQIIKSQAPNINEKVLRLGLIAYLKAKEKGLNKKQLLTVIDYSKPSSEKRFWVIDLKNNKTLYNTWVSHGKNSGGAISSSFSNSPGSLKSSLGVFVTEDTYDGKNGYSLRLRGLEPGVNDKAYERAVVIHGAPYVNPDIIKKYGQVGRSWGCPAVSKEVYKPLINTIKDDTVIFAYYPDSKWLSNSQFLSA